MLLYYQFVLKVITLFFESSPENMFIDFRERGRERERNLYQLSPRVRSLTGDQTRNLGMCPDWELQLFGVRGQCSNQLSHPAGATLVFCLRFHSMEGMQKGFLPRLLGDNVLSEFLENLFHTKFRYASC